MEYQRNFGSNFPDELIVPGTHKNVDDSVVNLVNQYHTFISNKDMASANDLYESNKSILEPYRFDMSTVNKLEEELYNTGLYAISLQSTIISEAEPIADQFVGGIWLKEY